MRVLTGAADGKILFLEDVTELEEMEEAGKREKKILQDQSLSNCLFEKVCFHKMYVRGVDTRCQCFPFCHLLFTLHVSSFVTFYPMSFRFAC